MRDPQTGQRLHQRQRGPRPADPVQQYRLVLPPSYVQKVKWDLLYERMAVAATTAAGVRGRDADDPVQGRVAVLPRDEREASKGKALLYADFTPGKQPVIAVGGGVEYTQDLVELVDEARHYGTDAPPPRERPDINAAWQDRISQDDRNRRGIKTYGAATRGLI